MSRDKYHAERKVITALTRRMTREMAATLDAMDPPPSDTLRKALIGQNVMRVCLETMLREMLPYDVGFLTELTTRLAAYGITAGPPWGHALMIETVQEALPATVRNKVQTGTGIKSDWIQDPTQH